MNKVLGIILSLVGNIGTVLVVLITLPVILTGVLGGTFNMVVSCILIALSIVLFIVANIGNNIQDNLQEGLKLKYWLFKLLGWIPNLLGWIIAIAGAFVALGGLGGMLLDPTLFEEFIPAEVVENGGVLVLGIAMFVGGAVWMNIFGTYVLHHCKHCGCNLKGGDYDYEEIERSAFFDNSDKVHLRSKIRFEFECPECGESTVFYKTLRTDGEQVDNYARSIVGKD